MCYVLELINFISTSTIQSTYQVQACTPSTYAHQAHSHVYVKVGGVYIIQSQFQITINNYAVNTSEVHVPIQHITSHMVWKYTCMCLLLV